MNTEIQIEQRRVNPLKFMLWLLIVSIIMMFAAFTSAYIVRREEGNWLEFDLPSILIINTLVLVLSSIFMQWAYVSAKKDNLKNLKLALALTIVAGVAFLIGQWQGWVELVKNNVFFGGSTANPSGSFLYVLTGVHAFHLVTGLVFLIIVVISALKYKVHSRNLNRIELCTIYWHFLGALWIYLYVFLVLNH
ncbi:cytochrome oxidase subunit III [Rufibacter immobilis]|uniref:Cytochrome oxidase subunit III n=1 Tax=Rufibacter immobilis TaxID=1348778 RepID=A0A3M9MV31_9BACT|nr:cytochrome c oxidase subunit 3 [Rufibacter immobilis]RNI29386.1 cytochrome oxidase subunit III [Rufibacter immobilis]